MNGLRFTDVQPFLLAGLTELGYGGENQPLTNPSVRTMPLIDPGPATAQALQKKSPGPIVFATPGFGAGLTLEQTYDQQFLTVRVLGQQNDYESAERLAWDLDRVLLAVQGSGTIGECRVLYVARTGGSPGLIDFDAASRHHFQTTYIIPAATGY